MTGASVLFDQQVRFRRDYCRQFPCLARGIITVPYTMLDIHCCLFDTVQ